MVNIINDKAALCAVGKGGDDLKLKFARYARKDSLDEGSDRASGHLTGPTT